MPLALIKQLEPVRGYNSFDIANYRRYLKRVAGDESELQPFDDAWTFPLIGDFPIQNQQLLDLLGVRYLVAARDAAWDRPWETMSIVEDTPRGYSVIEGGVVSMQPYGVWENPGAFPRCWTIGQNAVDEIDSADISLSTVLSRGVGAVEAAHMKRYEPNCIELLLELDEPSLLVVTDAWFPGWACYVDGESREIQLVEGLFRGVQLSETAKHVEFVFRPRSVWLGRWISIVTFCISVMAILFYQFGRGLSLQNSQRN